MTMRPFGNVTPTQMDMLRLAGYGVDYRARRICLSRSDDERLKNMRAGRARLHRETGQDFGFDLAAWHEFLTAGEDASGYRHPYAFAGVASAIRRAIGNKQRIRLAKELDERPRTNRCT
jgi:hypothetical protein